MKKIFILSSLSLILFSSCSKSGSADVSGVITCNIDGSVVSFNTSAKALRTDPSGAYSVQIMGFQGTAGTSNQIAIAITSTHSIVAGTYSENNSSSSDIASVNYVQSGNAYPYISNNSTTNPSTVTVSAASSTSLQGTFSGDVYLFSSSGVSSTKKVITNGQFNVNF